jgi:hypothetical protein
MAMFSFGTGTSDQEWHNITVTTSLLSAFSLYRLLPFNRKGSPLEGKEVRMVALNLFQSNFSATRILPSSYLFWMGKRLVDYL